MFRCITELKGLVVDIDSFDHIATSDWNEINQKVECVFLSRKETTVNQLLKHFNKERVLLLETFEMLFSPNKATHLRVLDILGIKNTELAYVSCNLLFLENASSFFSGTIWINEDVTYQEASESPDIVFDNVQQFKEELKAGIAGYYGEMVVFPGYSFKRANLLPVKFDCDDEEIQLYMLGRYFPVSHYLSQLHPYSIAIRSNKISGKSYSGVFDTVFTRLFSNAINHIKTAQNIDCVCAVPVKPGKTARFDKIVDDVSNKCNIENIGENFKCVRNYPDQKTLSASERADNVNGVFNYSGLLNGKTIALLDDISSTGSTIKECIRVLRRCGAKEIIVIILAINQNQYKEYWASDYPRISCSVCGSEMTLTPNKNGKFFFSCYACYKEGRGSNTLNFNEGWKQLCDNENNRFVDIMMQEKEPQVLCGDNEANGLLRRINCPHCKSVNTIDLYDHSSVSSNDRPMGPDSLYVFNTHITCTACSKVFRVEGNISFYPMNSIENEEINVSKDSGAL